MTLVLRTIKDAPLTFQEGDDNLLFLQGLSDSISGSLTSVSQSLVLVSASVAAITGSNGGGGVQSFISLGSVSASINSSIGPFVVKSGSITLLSVNRYGSILSGESGSVSTSLFSRAEGFQSATYANYSHAEGDNTTSSGQGSHSEGYYTTANGVGSHTEGSGSVTYGDYSHAEGSNTRANGVFSHSEGIFANASALGSHAEGGSTQANGNYSHAEGYNTKSDGLGSHSEGYYAVSSGSYSHAEGSGSIAYGSYSHASGISTRTDPTTPGQKVMGKFNTSTPGALVVVGNGVSNVSRSNLMELYNDLIAHIEATLFYKPVTLSAQGGAPTLKAPGTIYFDGNDGHFYGWNGTVWKQLDN